MSLLTGASLWQNDEPNKKRIAKLKKPDINSSQMDDIQSYKNMTVTPSFTQEMENSADKTQNRVNDLLNKMTSVSIDNDGQKLSNFIPLSNPEMSPSKNIEFMTNGLIDNINNQPNFPQNNQPNFPQNNQLLSNDIHLANTTNYRNAYQQPTNKPYYSKMGIGGNIDNKLLEKINYMIHLLEEQQNEKTNNITEEFILYTFLGVFIIYVLDSFARTGKYIR